MHLGPLAVRWYGLTYLIGFGLIWLFGRHAIKHRAHSVWSNADLDDALFYGILGTILGGRLGYVFFYKFSDYFAEPWRIFYLWEGGMSFHGGFLGVLAAMAWVAWRQRIDWWALMDFVAPLVPVGLAAAIIMSQIYHRARGTFYLVTVSPVLTPGVIIGISK